MPNKTYRLHIMWTCFSIRCCCSYDLEVFKAFKENSEKQQLSLRLRLAGWSSLVQSGLWRWSLPFYWLVKRYTELLFLNGLARAPGHVPLDFLSATERAPRKWSGFVACTATQAQSQSQLKQKTTTTTTLVWNEMEPVEWQSVAHQCAPSPGTIGCPRGQFVSGELLCKECPNADVSMSAHLLLSLSRSRSLTELLAKNPLNKPLCVRLIDHKIK